MSASTDNTTSRIVYKKNVGSLPATSREGPAVEIALLSEDFGHRHGNFHNYYHFHPPQERLLQLQDVVKYIANAYSSDKSVSTNNNTGDRFRYSDLGCNEGDLTMGVVSALEQHLGCCSSSIEFQGMDIDNELIDRANTKWSSRRSSTNHGGPIEGKFIQGDIVTNLQCGLEAQQDLISLFSTTMWIHIHAGDKGLEQVLRTMCRKSKRFLLIEPQPSKCYRNAVQRLKKMRRPPISIEGLTWRPNLQEKIDNVVREEGNFYPALVSDRTSWNRKLVLYEKRCESNEPESSTSSHSAIGEFVGKKRRIEEPEVATT